MTCTDLCTALLPPQAPLHIETLGMTERGMTLDVAVTTPQAHYGHDRVRDDAGRGDHHLTGPLSDVYPAVHARP